VIPRRKTDDVQDPTPILDAYTRAAQSADPGVAHGALAQLINASSDEELITLAERVAEEREISVDDALLVLEVFLRGGG
jgi:hypothetical protein